jgi:hypothetical protein
MYPRERAPNAPSKATIFLVFLAGAVLSFSIVSNLNLIMNPGSTLPAGAPCWQRQRRRWI